MSVVSNIQDQIHQSISGVNEQDKNQVTQRPRGVKMAISLTVVAFYLVHCWRCNCVQRRRLRANRVDQAQSYEAETVKLKATQEQLIEEARNRASLQIKLAGLQDKLKSGAAITTQQLNSLNQQIKKLQVAAGLATVSGKGIVIKLSDNPNAAQNSVGAFLPGLVHDYDVLQVVNELRAAKGGCHFSEQNAASRATRQFVVSVR